ncbi:nitrous oxide reductase accessory protein NosL [Limibacter armeniacum]|uniref:nitrous oxide reductase accessory protein NosL n=1 Tax=Limibacter armeniacum TaxID=466084 RepID=UPI002FE630A9
MRYLLGALTVLMLCITGCNTKTSDQGNTETETTSQVNYDCAFCGMPSQEYPKWNANTTSQDGTEKHYCSSRCLFVAITETKEMAESLKTVNVTDYYTLKKTDGKSAYYVSGSDITGPMGKGFVAFSSKEAADEFSKDHNGKQVLTFEEIDLEAVKASIED